MYILEKYACKQRPKENNISYLGWHLKTRKTFLNNVKVKKKNIPTRHKQQKNCKTLFLFY
jgi:hypothetical protein